MKFPETLLEFQEQFPDEEACWKALCRVPLTARGNQAPQRDQAPTGRSRVWLSAPPRRAGQGGRSPKETLPQTAASGSGRPHGSPAPTRRGRIQAARVRSRSGHGPNDR